MDLGGPPRRRSESVDCPPPRRMSDLEGALPAADPTDITEAVGVPLREFEAWLINQKEDKRMLAEAQKLFTKLIPYKDEICKNIAFFVQTIRVFSRAQEQGKMIFCFSRAQKSYTDFIIHLFIQSCVFGDKNSQILLLSEKFFVPFFSDGKFVIDTLSSDLPQKFFDNVCGTCHTQDAIDWGFRIMLGHIDNKVYKLLNPRNFFQAFASFIESGKNVEMNRIIGYQVREFTTKAADFNPNTAQILYSVDKFQTLENLLSDQDWEDFLSVILVAGLDGKGVNETVVQVLVEFLQIGRLSRQQVFRIVGQTKMYRAVNPFLPIISFFNDETVPLDDFRSVLPIIWDLYPEMIKDVMLPLCKRLESQTFSKAEMYQPMFTVVHVLLGEDWFRNNAPLVGAFLTAVIVRPPVEMRTALFRENEWITDRLVSLLPSTTEEKRDSVFVAMLEMSEASPSMAVKVLVRYPKKACVKRFIEFLNECSREKVLGVLKLALGNRENPVPLANKFISHGGLDALDHLLDCGKISGQEFGEIVAILASVRHFEELEQFIQRLPQTHPIYKLPAEKYDDIVYGMNKADIRPIRLAALFHMLSSTEHTDPYNSYVIGRFALKVMMRTGMSIHSIPQLRCIANRYIRSKYVDPILQRPENVDMFCDVDAFDHFPMFQLYPGDGDLVCDVEHKSLSFWCKFEDREVKGCKFFESNNYLSLTLMPNWVVVNIGENEYRTKNNLWKVGEWNHFLLQFEVPRFLSASVSVYVNHELVVSKSVSGKGGFTRVFFRNQSKKLMFLGSAIRFFLDTVSSANDLSENPGLIDSLNEFALLTPLNISLPSDHYKVTVPSNCCSVPYCGFAMHFVSASRFAELLGILVESKSLEQFNSTFRAILNIYAVVGKYFDHFWSNLLGSLKYCRQFISKDLLEKALKHVLENDHSMSSLQLLLFDQEVWNALDNEMLLDVIQDIFTNSKVDIDDLDLFFTKVILKNPKSENIVYKILKMGRAKNIGTCLMAILKNELEDDARSTVANCLARYARTDGREVLKVLQLDSNVLVTMLRFSDGKFTAAIYSLYTELCRLDKLFRVMDSGILTPIMCLSHEASVWENTLKLVELDISYVPILLGLIGARGLCIIDKVSRSQQLDNSVSFYFKQGVSRCLEVCDEILANNLCLTLLTSLFPIILAVPVFYVRCQDEDLIGFVRKVLSGDLSSESVTDLSHPFMTVPVNEFVRTSELFHLYANLIIHANQIQFKQLFPALVLSYPYYDEPWAGSFFGSLVVRVLQSDMKKFACLTTFLSYVFYYISAKCFVHDVDQKQYLFNALKNVPDSAWNSEPYVFTIIELLSSMPNDIACINVEDNLEFILKVFSSRVHLHYLATKNDKIRATLERHVKLDPRLLSTVSETQDIKTKQNALIERAEKSLEVRYSAEAFYSLLTLTSAENEEKLKMQRRGEQKVRMLQSAFDIITENTKWNRFVSSLHDKMVDVAHFKPKSYHLSPKCFPFEAPRLLIASLYAFHSQELLRRFKAHSEKFKDRAESVSLKTLFLKMFIEKKQHHCCQVDLHRYTGRVKSVMFIFPDEIMFLTFAELGDNDEITLTDYTDEYFIESAILGLWGRTSMFFGHIVIQIPMSQIIFVQLFMGYFSFWTFGAGHFLVAPSRRDLAAIRLKMANIAEESKKRLSSAPLFLRVAQLLVPDERVAAKKWSSGEISTDELLLVLNGLRGKRFASIREYPYFPLKFSSFKDRHISTKETATLLTKIIPFAAFGMDSELYFPQTNAELLLEGPSSDIHDDQPVTLNSRSRRCVSNGRLKLPGDLLSITHNENRDSGIGSVQLATPKFERNDRRSKKMRRASYIPPQIPRSPPSLEESSLRSRLDSTTGDVLMTSSECKRVVAQFTSPDFEINTEISDIPALFYYVPELFSGSHPLQQDEEPVPLDYGLIFRRRLALEFEPRISDWISAWKLSDRVWSRQETGSRLRNLEIADPNLSHVCQRLKHQCPKSNTLVEVGDQLIRVKRLTVQINSTHKVEIDKCSSSISILSITTNRKVSTVTNNFLFFAKAIAISENQMFIVVDFELGLSRCYQVIYKQDQPQELLQISEFAWKGSPTSTVSGVHWLVASFVRNTLVLWDMFAGVIHRTVTFDHVITAASFDEHYGVWVATVSRGYFISVNGEVLASRPLQEEITNIAPFQHHSIQENRCAVIGTVHGSVLLAVLRFDIRTFDVRKLPSEHKAEIDNIIISQSNKFFVTIDCNEIAYHWSAPGMNPPLLNLACYSNCVSCHAEVTQTVCRSCGHAICQMCAIGEKCPYCVDLVCF